MVVVGVPLGPRLSELEFYFLPLLALCENMLLNLSRPLFSF